MANIKSIGGNPIVLDASGIAPGAVTPDKLAASASFDGITAGAALGITGEATDSAAWLQRVSTSDGPTTIHSIHGRTLRWNQLVNYGIMWGNGSTLTTSGNTVTVTSTNTSGSYFGVAVVPTARHTAVNGHKYYIVADVDMTGITDQTLSKVAVNFGSLIATFVGTDSLTASGRIACIAATRATGTGGSTYINAMFSSAHDTSGQSFAVTNAMVMDLTQMFGAGNEPSTVAEFEALYSQPYYEYDAGSLLPVNMTGIESTAADESWTQTRTIPAGTLRSAGTVYDELTKTERITRIGERAYQSGDESDATVVTDGTVTHYVLATPTTAEIDPPLNLTYRTETGGTERVMVPTGEQSAPPTIVTAQGYTAESLRDAALSAIAPVENGRASANYGVGSYLVHGGQLCKVTTAIATGEAISIGTNVTATTVMAEVIALIAQ